MQNFKLIYDNPILELEYIFKKKTINGWKYGPPPHKINFEEIQTFIKSSSGSNLAVNNINIV